MEKQKNKTTLYHLVLDKSESMSGCFGETLSALNDQMNGVRELQQQYPDDEFLVSFTSFNHEVTREWSSKNTTEDLSINENIIRPSGMTALIDAIGLSIEQTSMDLRHKLENEEASVVMVILTDGFENASRLFHHRQIRSLIEQKEATGLWTFSFLGADIDAFIASDNIFSNKQNVRSFGKSDMKGMMDDVTDSLKDYMDKKSKGKINSDFFEELKRKKRNQY